MMSKRIHRPLLIAAVVTAALFASYLVGAQAPQRTGVNPNVAKNAAIVAATEEILKETSVIRQLPILRPVKSGAESRAAIERMLIKNLNERTTTAEMHGAEASLKKFGLADSKFEYRSFIVKLLAEQVAGYYDPKAQEFYLADWLELETQKPVMAHELAHALQDQHFNLRRFEKWPDGDSDAELAAHALIEGDATLAMNLYLAENPLVALAFGRSLLTGVPTEQYDKAPRAMRESLIFPYLQGSLWATQLYKRGGWKMVSDAFSRLPLSTEQILHPEKYFKYERPVKVVLPDVAHLLNTASKQQTGNSNQRNPVSIEQSVVSSQQDTGSAGVSPAPLNKTNQRRTKAALPTANRRLPTGSWRRIEYDVNGEWTYYLILDQFLKSPAESKRASAGWAGDRFALYEGPNGQLFLAQVTVWDTEDDAKEFFEAYVKRTELRYPGLKWESNEAVKSELRNTYSAQTSEGNAVLEQRGSRVLILEGVPTGVNSELLTNILWQ